MTSFQEMLEACRAGTRELAPITRLLDIRLLEWGPGTARVEMLADERHHNALGSVHGGIFCDLADVALGCALASTLSDRNGFTTLDLSMRYFKSAQSGLLQATAKVVRLGSRIAYLECLILDEADQLIAKAASTCMIYAKGT